MVACGEQHMACTVVHGWVPDEEAKDCMACRRGFTPVRRRVSSFHLSLSLSIPSLFLSSFSVVLLRERAII